MEKITLGRSGLVVPRNGFGALPIQRISEADAVRLVRRAFDGGMYYFDTARFYTDSESKLGAAFRFGEPDAYARRSDVVISTKTGATTVEGFWKDLHTSLRDLRTDYVDLYQFHNLPFCPKPGMAEGTEGAGLYEAMLEARQQGKVRHIGITNHRQRVAIEAIDSGLYETLQYPFSYLASEADHDIVRRTLDVGMGFICMKGLSGGLISHSDVAYAWLAQYDVAPIWGIQKETELDEWLSYQDNPPRLTDEMCAVIEKDRRDLSGNFCRGCGYCQPCPAGIQIQDCNRMSLFLRRAPHSVYLTESWYREMMKIDGCLHCNHCVKHCPYGLDTPNLLVRNKEDFLTFWHNRQK
ncbi:MAG: aldo/keto reductase [Bacteroidales bacterium]|nr:aldo/keto reductase [Bacteroidales bacterium]